MENNYRFRLLINVENTDDESLVSIVFPSNRTVGELGEFIKTRLNREGLQGDIYLLLNEYEREFNDDFLLGGVLLPNDLPIQQTVIENGVIFYAKCTEIEPNTEEEEEEEEITVNTTNSVHNDMYDYLMERMTRTSNSLNSLATLSTLLSHNSLNSDLDVIINGLSRNMNFGMIGRSPSTQPTIISTSGISGNTHYSGLSVNGNLGNGNSQMYISYSNSSQSENPLNQIISIMNSLGARTSTRMEDVVVGLHKDDLDALRVNLYKNFDAKDKCDMCSVCIDKFKEEDVCRELKCHHLFHKDCIDHWLDNNIKCPVCRMETGRGVPKL